jgi:hypothetical protein
VKALITRGWTDRMATNRYRDAAVPASTDCGSHDAARLELAEHLYRPRQRTCLLVRTRPELYDVRLPVPHRDTPEVDAEGRSRYASK